MCIIVYKPEGVAFPEEQVLKNCFENNPDGAGYMYSNGFRVVIRKGFMTWEAFKKALDKTRKAHGEKVPYVLHFRISTQAGVREDNTHPFPLSADMEDLRALRQCCSVGIAHNGIISLTSSYSRTITHSDTMEFITDYLTLIIKKLHYYEDRDDVELITKLIGNSRLAVLDAEKHCQLFGSGWIEDGGLYYSNSGYKARPAVTTLKSYTSYNINVMEDYEKYYNKSTGLYDFPYHVCPLWDCGVKKYCSKCVDRKKCNF